MKKFMFIIVLIMTTWSLSAIAQTNSEDCYVYSYLHFAGKGYKAHGGMILSVSSEEGFPILGPDNEELTFSTWRAAMSYLTTLGWEFVCIDYNNPEAVNAKDRYILIRKKTTKDEAVSLSLPETK